MEFGILGSLQVRDESGTRAVAAAKQRALLAVLLLRSGCVVPLGTIADLIWDGRPPGSALSSLRNYVMRLRRVLRQDRPGSYVHTVGGGLGWGIGAAVGHRLGDPERPVVAVLGDGCAMFGLQGLWTAARYRVPAAFVVMSNGEYRTLKDTLDHMGSRSSSAGRYVGLDLGLDAEPGPARLDWTAAARFFGVASVRVESAEHLRETVARAGRLDGPLLIEAPVLGHDEM